MDYSQSGEQAAILECFKEQASGRFLDIGAWDPEQFSNTRALVELGWTGVLIEPSPTPLLNLVKRYGPDPHFTVISAAVGLEAGLSRLHVTDDAVSTLSDAQHEHWKEHAHYIGSMVVQTITLEQIFNQFGGFDFINIDAEGVSADLFLKMLALGVTPACCCVEHDGRTTELLTAASPLNYSGKVIGANLIVWR